MTSWPFNDLVPLSCDLIVADPPWDFENYSDAGTVKGADPHYQVMPLARTGTGMKGSTGN